MADYEWLYEIIERQAGSHAHGSLLGDATGIAIIRYAEWEDAKRGIISRREFVKFSKYLFVDNIDNSNGVGDNNKNDNGRD